jgi:hypothetical protein
MRPFTSGTILLRASTSTLIIIPRVIVMLGRFILLVKRLYLQSRAGVLATTIANTAILHNICLASLWNSACQ